MGMVSFSPLGDKNKRVREIKRSPIRGLKKKEQRRLFSGLPFSLRKCPDQGFPTLRSAHLEENSTTESLSFNLPDGFFITIHAVHKSDLLREGGDRPLVRV